MICIYVDLLYVDTKISELNCTFWFFKLRIIQLLYIAQRESCTEACSIVWTTAARRMMRASFNVKSVYCSSCCLVRVVCYVLSSCGVAKKNLRGSRWSETGPVVICQFSRLWTPRARATDLGQGPHLHPVFTRAPRNREHEERPAGGRAKNAGVQETSIWRTVIYGVQYVTAMYNTSYLRLWLRPNKLSDIRPISRIEFVRRSSYVSVVNGRACSVVGDHTNLLQLGCEPIL